MIKWSFSGSGNNYDCYWINDILSVETIDLQGKTIDLNSLKIKSGIDFSLQRLLSEHLPDNIKQGMLFISRGDELVACAGLQWIDFNFHSYLNPETDSGSSAIRNLCKRVLHKMGSVFNGKILVLGQLVVPGMKTSWISDEIPGQMKEHWWERALDHLVSDTIDFSNIELSAVAVVHSGNSPNSSKTRPFASWHSYRIEPVMEIGNLTKWKKFDHYRSSLRSKYRKKINAVLKKSPSLEIREMTTEDIHRHRERIMYLFNRLLSSSTYNLVSPQFEFFRELIDVPDLDYHICGIFEGDRLLAFYSWFQYGTTTEGHYLGYDPADLQRYDLYKLILIQLLKQALNSGSECLYLGRTATVVKADLGARSIPSFVSIKPIGWKRSKLLPVYYQMFYRPGNLRNRNVFK